MSDRDPYVRARRQFGRSALTALAIVALVVVLSSPAGGVLLDPLVAQLSLTVDPSDMSVVQKASLTVHGTLAVSPGSSGRVTIGVNGGQPVEASFRGSSYSQDVALRHGPNLLHVRATSTVGWRTLTETRDISVTVEPATLDAPRLDPVTNAVGSSSTVITGSAQPGVSVALMVDGQPRGAAVASGITGRFAVHVQDLTPGQHVIAAVARTSTIDAGPASVPIRVKYDPDTPATTAPLTRRLGITRSATSIHLELKLMLPVDDYRAAGLISGALSVQEFVGETFGRLMIDGDDAASWFREATPAITIGGGTVNVDVQSRPELESRQLAHELVVEVDDGDFLADDRDRLHIAVPDYHIERVSPTPASLSGTDATWQGPQTLSDDRVVASIQPDLSNPAVALSLRPGDFLPWPSVPALVLEFVEAGMNGLILVWYLWLRRRYADLPWPFPDGGRAFDRFVRLLIGLCFVTPMLDVLRLTMPAGPLRDLSRHLPGDASRPEFGAALSVVIGILAAAAAWRRRPRLRWAPSPWVWEPVRGLLVAAVAAGILFGLVVLWDRMGQRLDPGLVVLLATGPVMAALVVMALRHAAMVSPATAAHARAPVGWLVLASAAAIAGGLCWPVATLGSAIDPPGIDAVVWVVASTYYLVQYYAAYAVLIGIAGVLRLGGDSPRHRKRRAALGVLVFANLVVPVSPYFFGVPLSFLLGLAAWLWVARERRAMRQALDDAAPVVVEHRNALLAGQGEAPVGHVRDGGLRSLVVRMRDRRRPDPLAALPVRARDRPLAVGPTGDRWSDGLSAMWLGLLLIVPWLTLDFVFFAFRPGSYSTPVLLLSVATDVAGQLVGWLVLAFFFGSSFSDIRGRSGTRKGLLLAVVVVACSLPSWVPNLRSGANGVPTLILIGIYVVFVTGIGLAFDLRAAPAARDGLGWVAFGRMSGFGSLAAFSSLVLAGAGGALASALTGELVSLLSLAAHLAGAPAVPVAPGGH